MTSTHMGKRINIQESRPFSRLEQLPCSQLLSTLGMAVLFLGSSNMILPVSLPTAGELEGPAVFWRFSAGTAPSQDPDIFKSITDAGDWRCSPPVAVPRFMAIVIIKESYESLNVDIGNGAIQRPCAKWVQH